tara:strand:- start:3039 stop:3488 length:450 start_codon:yes stop_codon:yes gene_type:complete
MMKRIFTGKDMAIILICGFAVVVAVNFYMASVAIGGFGGVVVENSYVASQKYNGWLEQARRTEKLGYAVSVDRDSQGRLAAIVDNAPANAKISAELRRPLGQPEMRTISLQRNADGRYLSRDPLPSGRWIARITVDTGSAPWIDELEIK